MRASAYKLKRQRDNRARLPRGGPTNPFAGVSRDATSGIYVPANSSEWTTFLAAAGLSGVVAVPSALWLLQEASGNAADSIGSFTLTAGAGLTYQQSETGWTRKGVKFTDGTAGTSLSSSSASLPDIASASMTTLIIANATASTAGNRILLLHGNPAANRNRIRITSTPEMAVLSNGNIANGTSGANGPLNAVRPYVLRTNRTANSCVGTRDTEKLTPTFDATISGKGLDIGASSLSPTFNLLYACNWHNANAEISDANLKTLLQMMGFTISWS